MCAALATLAPCLRAPNAIGGSFLCVRLATLAACLRAPNALMLMYSCVRLATLAACLRAPNALESEICLCPTCALVLRAPFRARPRPLRRACVLGALPLRVFARPRGVGCARAGGCPRRGALPPSRRAPLPALPLCGFGSRALWRAPPLPPCALCPSGALRPRARLSAFGRWWRSCRPPPAPRCGARRFSLGRSRPCSPRAPLLGGSRVARPALRFGAFSVFSLRPLGASASALWFVPSSSPPSPHPLPPTPSRAPRGCLRSP